MLNSQTWYTNSGFMFYSEAITPGVTVLFIAEILFGSLFLLHSFILKGIKFDTVRICSDICAALVLMQGVLYLQCLSKDLDPICPIRTQAIYNDLFCNLFGNGIATACDLYITFVRYDVIIGGASVLHKRLALLWVAIFCFGWLPFSTILPIFYDMNSMYWIDIQFIICQWSLFSGYAVFDIFYIIMVIRELRKLLRIQPEGIGTENRKWIFAFTIKSIFHTLTSLLGVLSIAYAPFLGIPVQTLLISFALHAFLNWRTWSLRSLVPSCLVAYFGSVLSSAQSNDQRELAASTAAFKIEQAEGRARSQGQLRPQEGAPLVSRALRDSKEGEPAREARFESSGMLNRMDGDADELRPSEAVNTTNTKPTHVTGGLPEEYEALEGGAEAAAAGAADKPVEGSLERDVEEG